jgi:Zn-dependent peptidase ImmA (M78 family)
MQAKLFKVPKNLLICGRKVKIVVTHNLQESGQVVHGYFDASEHMIALRSDKSEVMRDTLLHEILHAILHYSGHSHLVGSGEEGLVVAIENGLAPLLKHFR